MAQTQRRYRPRKQERFWLYRDIALEARLIEYVAYLRKTKAFAETIRNGLRLMWTLSEGKTEVLEELFPGIVSSLKASAAPPTPGDDFQQMLEQAAKKGAELALLQAPPPQMPTGSPNGLAMHSAPSLPGGSMADRFKNLALTPIVDDDGDTVVIRKDANAGMSVLENMMRSVSAAASAPVAADAPKLAAPRDFKRRHDDESGDLTARRAVQ